MLFALWVAFVLFILGMLALDLFVVNRGAHTISLRRALLWSGFCCLLALLFTVFVYFAYTHAWLGLQVSSAPLRPNDGMTAAVQFLSAWLVEQSLSLDNIFVIALIFQYFNVPAAYQHRTLFYGIVGALAFRGIMIALGVALIAQFKWILYVFGLLLILTALKMLFAKEEHVAPDRNPLVRLARRFVRVSPNFDREKFFTWVDGHRALTPLFLALLVIESTDVMFAIDSIPAVFGLTSDPFIVFTSNVFAILNLRSLYFALAGLLARFRYLKLSLVIVLLFVGVKMLFLHHLHAAISLGIIAGTLTVGGVASVIHDRLAVTRRAGAG